MSRAKTQPLEWRHHFMILTLAVASVNMHNRSKHSIAKPAIKERVDNPDINQSMLVTSVLVTTKKIRLDTAALDPLFMYTGSQQTSNILIMHDAFQNKVFTHNKTITNCACRSVLARNAA